MTAVLLNDVGAAGRMGVAERRSVRLILQTDVDDAVQGNAMPGQGIVDRAAFPPSRCCARGDCAAAAPAATTERQRQPSAENSQLRRPCATDKLEIMLACSLL